MMDTRTRLKQKGWNDEDIAKAVAIINKSEEKKPNLIRVIDVIAYWGALLLAIFGNLIIAIILVPFLLALKQLPLYITTVILGLTFGFLFEILIRDIERIEKKHQIIVGMFIPALAIISVYYMTKFSNHLNQTLRLSTITQNPLTVGIIYTIAFMVPYVSRKIKEAKE